MAIARAPSSTGCTLVPDVQSGRSTTKERFAQHAGDVVADVRIADAKLTNVVIGPAAHVTPLPTMHRLVLERCELHASHVSNVVLSECNLELTRSTLVPFSGVLFDRTVLRGDRIGAVIVRDTPDDRAPAHRRRFYERVEWALDLREAHFASQPSLRNVPGSKCRLDPKTQGIALRAPTLAAIRSGALTDQHPFWPSLHYGFDGASWGGRDFTDYDELVIVVPTRSAKKRRFQEGLDDLRARGIAR